IHMRTALPVLVLFACVQVYAPAQQNVRARGSATVSVAPDQAIVEIGVVTQAATAEAAAAANAKQLQKVLAELRRVSGPAAQIKTTSGQTANIVLTDVQGINGVVHVVDKVLLP
ncbi:MAG TPA: SIMPL domain-containing protein, partial [Bacteroidales bacterium]|nr:SIMPL domain-containing protein [Bacteroidales bacterium]